MGRDDELPGWLYENRLILSKASASEKLASPDASGDGVFKVRHLHKGAQTRCRHFNRIPYITREAAALELNLFLMYNAHARQLVRAVFFAGTNPALHVIRQACWVIWKSIAQHATHVMPQVQRVGTNT